MNDDVPAMGQKRVQPASNKGKPLPVNIPRAQIKSVNAPGTEPMGPLPPGAIQAADVSRELPSVLTPANRGAGGFASTSRPFPPGGLPPAPRVPVGGNPAPAPPIGKGGQPINIRQNIASKPIQKFPSMGRPTPPVDPIPLEQGLNPLPPMDPNLGIRPGQPIPLEEGLATKFPALQSRSPAPQVSRTPPASIARPYAVPSVGENAGAYLTAIMRRPATASPNTYHPEPLFEVGPEAMETTGIGPNAYNALRGGIRPGQPTGPPARRYPSPLVQTKLPPEVRGTGTFVPKQGGPRLPATPQAPTLPPEVRGTGTFVPKQGGPRLPAATPPATPAPAASPTAAPTVPTPGVAPPAAPTPPSGGPAPGGPSAIPTTPAPAGTTPWEPTAYDYAPERWKPGEAPGGPRRITPGAAPAPPPTPTPPPGGTPPPGAAPPPSGKAKGKAPGAGAGSGIPRGTKTPPPPRMPPPGSAWENEPGLISRAWSGAKNLFGYGKTGLGAVGAGARIANKAAGFGLSKAPGALAKTGRASLSGMGMQAVANPEGAVWAVGHPGDALRSLAGGVGGLVGSLGDGRARQFAGQWLHGDPEAAHALNEAVNPVMWGAQAGHTIGKEVVDTYRGTGTLPQRLSAAWNAPSAAQQGVLDQKQAGLAREMETNPNHLTPENLTQVRQMGQNPLHYADSYGGLTRLPTAPPLGSAIGAPPSGGFPAGGDARPDESMPAFNARMGEQYQQDNPVVTGLGQAQGATTQAGQFGTPPSAPGFQLPGATPPAPPPSPTVAGRGPAPTVPGTTTYRGGKIERTAYQMPQGQAQGQPAAGGDPVLSGMMRSYQDLVQGGPVGSGDSMGDLRQQHRAQVAAMGKQISDYQSARAQDVESGAHAGLYKEQAKPVATRMEEINKSPGARATHRVESNVDPAHIPAYEQDAQRANQATSGAEAAVDGANWQDQLMNNQHYANLRPHLLPQTAGVPNPLESIIDNVSQFPGATFNPNVMAMIQHAVKAQYPGPALEEARKGLAPGFFNSVFGGDKGWGAKRQNYGAQMGLWKNEQQ